jgi:hypothetical protein
MTALLARGLLRVSITAGLRTQTCNFGGTRPTLAVVVCSVRSLGPSSATPYVPPARYTIGVTRATAAGRAARRCAGACIVSCARSPTRSARTVVTGRSSGGSRRPRRTCRPRCQTEIIEEIGRWPFLPILQTMFEGRKGEWQPARRSNDCVRLAPGREQYPFVAMNKKRVQTPLR